jgi:hypothetical protein
MEFLDLLAVEDLEINLVELYRFEKKSSKMVKM